MIRFALFLLVLSIASESRGADSLYYPIAGDFKFSVSGLRLTRIRTTEDYIQNVICVDSGWYNLSIADDWWSAEQMLVTCRAVCSFPCDSGAQPVLNAKTSPSIYCGLAIGFIFKDPVYLGWGIEGGVRLGRFLMGVEVGMCQIPLGIISSTDNIPDGIRSDDLSIDEYYCGLHTCITLDGLLPNVAAGVVVLFDFQKVYAPLHSALTAGPDIRYIGVKNLIFGIAYTISRGLKFGTDYVF
jgi:hypothetical protein